MLQQNRHMSELALENMSTTLDKWQKGVRREKAMCVLLLVCGRCGVPVAIDMTPLPHAQLPHIEHVQQLHAGDAAGAGLGVGQRV